MTRHSPETRETVIIVAHSAFQTPSTEHYPVFKAKDNYQGIVPPLQISGLSISQLLNELPM